MLKEIKTKSNTNQEEAKQVKVNKRKLHKEERRNVRKWVSEFVTI